MSTLEMYVNRMHPNVKLPYRAFESDAGLDICSNEKITLHPGQHHFISTGLKIAIPPNYVGLIWPRSGLARQYAIDTLAGVIDAGYCGEVQVGLINHGVKAVHINYGDRIAQMVVQPIAPVAVIEVSHLDATDRGEMGFGSTDRPTFEYKSAMNDLNNIELRIKSDEFVGTGELHLFNKKLSYFYTLPLNDEQTSELNEVSRVFAEICQLYKSTKSAD